MGQVGRKHTDRWMDWQTDSQTHRLIDTDTINVDPQKRMNSVGAKEYNHVGSFATLLSLQCVSLCV